MALGDINVDGYDDFAMGSGYDTTFIFLGGDPFDHEPAFFLSGGATGLACADFNGDGRRDLVTGVAMKNRDLDPEKRGRISVYFGKVSAPFLGPEPDLVIRGDSMQYWGSASFPGPDGDHRSGLQVLDFNGDGYDDLLTQTRTGRLPVMYQPIIFFGGPGFDTVPDVEIHAVDRGSSNLYPMDILIGDLNGDGCDDVLLHGSYIESSGRVNYWDLFLGNREGTASHPYRMLRSDRGWSPEKDGVSAIFDVNGDGIDDIIDGEEHRDYGDPLVFLGSRELPENIVPNDSIPNPWPTFGGIVGARSIHPVGDMNGDGTRDLLISWATYFYGTASLYYLYPMRPDGLVREHSGYIGMIPEDDWVINGAYDVGDVNGDGFDDFAVCGRGGAEPPTIGWWYTRRFIICLGASNLRTALQPLATTPEISLEAYPNPAFVWTSSVTLRLRGLEAGPVFVEIVDLIGRVVFREEKDTLAAATGVSVPISGLRPGNYFVCMRQGNAVARTVITII
ncbi:MAG: T9SS type A sorting domain-containing protein [Bacteroidetes bacterium]|nr:T9SS type A sorting domain-containing protein [Bacteroidota bacterium]